MMGFVAAGIVGLAAVIVLVASGAGSAATGESVRVVSAEAVASTVPASTTTTVQPTTTTATVAPATTVPAETTTTTTTTTAAPATTTTTTTVPPTSTTTTTAAPATTTTTTALPVVTLPPETTTSIAQAESQPSEPHPATVNTYYAEMPTIGLAVPVVLGNHDQGVVDAGNAAFFNNCTPSQHGQCTTHLAGH